MHTEKGVSVVADAISVQTEVSSPSAAENRLQITSSNMEDGGPGLGRLTSTGLQLPTWAPVMVRYLKRCVKNGVIQQITQGLRLKSADNKCVNSGEMEWKAVIKLDSHGYGSRSTVIERKVQILGGEEMCCSSSRLSGAVIVVPTVHLAICPELLFRRLHIKAYSMRKGSSVVK